MQYLIIKMIRYCHPELVEGSLAHARQTPIQARFLVSLGMTLIAFAFLFLNSHFAFAQNVRYPISDLGNCRNARECQLYCDIPSHNPVCWSYGKYVLNKDVLGDTTINITYPIADLGNCATAQECFIYCSQPAHQPACFTYARKNGLVKEETPGQPTPPPEIIDAAKSELGCTSKDTCMNLCSDPANMEKCRSFAQKHNLDKGESRPPPAEVITKAKTDLGCDSETSCRNFCEKPENREKCFAFARKNNLIKPEEVREMEKHMEQKIKMVGAAKTELGCDSENSCMKICSDPSNSEKCMNLGKKFGMVEEVKDKMNNQGFKNIEPKSLAPCTSETECKKYCENHPDECPGFNQQKTQIHPQESPSPLSPQTPQSPRSTQEGSLQKGDFLGPSGCKTEDECKSYCEKHPSECPGFPKPNSGSSQNPGQKNKQDNFDAPRYDSSGKNFSPTETPR